MEHVNASQLDLDNPAYHPETTVVAYQLLGGVEVVMDHRDYTVSGDAPEQKFADMAMRDIHYRVADAIPPHVQVAGELVKDKNLHPSYPAVFVVSSVVEDGIVLPWRHVQAWAHNLSLLVAPELARGLDAAEVISTARDAVGEGAFRVRPLDSYRYSDTAQKVAQYRR
jgi:hypothetical protein